MNQPANPILPGRSAAAQLAVLCLAAFALLSCAAESRIDFAHSPCWTCAAPLCTAAVEECDKRPACALALRCQQSCPATISGGPEAACVAACQRPVEQAAQLILDRVAQCWTSGIGARGCEACPQPAGQCQVTTALRDTFCQACDPRPGLPSCQACQQASCCKTAAACDAEPDCGWFLGCTAGCYEKFPLIDGKDSYSKDEIEQRQGCLRGCEDAVKPLARDLQQRDGACGYFVCDYQGFCASDQVDRSPCALCDLARCQEPRLRCTASYDCFAYDECLIECRLIAQPALRPACAASCKTRYASGVQALIDVDSCHRVQCAAECGTFPLP